jgi:ferric-dicitrate binding protein FerR (iron transport regulator)
LLLAQPTSQANQRLDDSELPVLQPESLERRSVVRKLIRLAITAAVTAFLVWLLPVAAQAGIVATGID